MCERRNPSRGRAFVAFAALLLSGCGFTPLYADHAQTVDDQLAAVSVDQISDHLGVVLTNHLRDGFNPDGQSQAAAYRLHVTLGEDNIGLSYRSDGTISQFQVDVTGSWELRRLSDKKVIGSGTSVGTSFYDDMPDAYANVAAQQSGEMRAVDQVSDDIHARIALLLKEAAPSS